MERKKLVIYIIAVLAVVTIVCLPGYSRMQKLREKSEEYLQRIELLEANNDKLKNELFKMEQDPEYLEKRAREKLGIVKEGEFLYKKQSVQE